MEPIDVIDCLRPCDIATPRYSKRGQKSVFILHLPLRFFSSLLLSSPLLSSIVPEVPDTLQRLQSPRR
jgi:hypothetical protein